MAPTENQTVIFFPDSSQINTGVGENYLWLKNNEFCYGRFLARKLKSVSLNKNL